MAELTPDQELMKRSIYDKMSPRRKKFIERMGGYDAWDPFQEPKDPVDIRKDASRRTAGQLVQQFYKSLTRDEKRSESYFRGAQEIAFGLMTDQDKVKGMFDYSVWYYNLLKKEGLVNDE